MNRFGIVCSICFISLLFIRCNFMKEIGGGYTKEEGKVYWGNGLGGSNGLLVSEADYKSFKAINHDYGKDKHHIFYRTEIIKDADLKSFETFNSVEYAKDKNAVYFAGKKIQGADVNSYELHSFVGVDNTYYYDYGMDKNHVFEFDKIVSDDPRHFVIINPNEHIWKDSKTIHWGNSILEGADAPSFEAILFKENSQEFSRYSSYYKDKDSIYVEIYEKGVIVDIVPLHGADVKSFHLISENFNQPEYAADHSTVYCENKIVEGADPSTFIITPDGKGKDKNFIYSGDKRVE